MQDWRCRRPGENVSTTLVPACTALPHEGTTTRLGAARRRVMMVPLSDWSVEARRGIVGVFTDIDDTLTTHGAITSDALEALAALRDAGLLVIPITGRPIGWCEPFLSGANTAPWPVNAMVAENGAIAYITPQPPWNGRRALSKLYQQDAALRTKNQKLMQEVAARVMAQVPGLQLSRDSAGRETDLAFDYNEFATLSPDTVAQVLAALRQAGMHTSVSSIHIHGCFGDFNKWQGACWIVRQCLQRDLAQELDHWVFVGDSGNDQAMFQHFTHSVGVANIRRFESQLDYLPRYITPSTHGAGFTEVANALLQARENGPTSTTIQGHA